MLNIHSIVDELGDQILESRYLEKIGDSRLLRLVTDSRKFQEGDVFIAYRGVGHDGHEYISSLTQPGLIICEKAIDISSPWIRVTNARKAWAQLCAREMEHPQRSLRMIGITGTNGKTSTVWNLRQMFEQAGQPVLAIGTLGIMMAGETLPSTHTTPDPPQLFAILRRAVDLGIETAIMEVSSHAIYQEKLAPIQFDAVGFTSFSRDHLDLHGTMEAYFAEKKRLFTELAKPDAHRWMCAGIERPWIISEAKTYGFTRGILPDVAIDRIVSNHQGSQISGVSFGSMQLPFVGLYSCENALLAACIYKDFFGQWPTAKLVSVPGRMEVVGHQQSDKPLVLVDYAHTPDALEKVLKALRALPQKKITVVFGCGGDRDRGKRPMMRQIAETWADCVIVTSDNPRTEDPESIIRDIVGASTKVKVMVDRREAIAWAIASSDASGVVLLAGKGHEETMEIAGRKIPFDDRCVAREFLQ